MIYSPQDLLGTTESLLKYDEDERLSEASPQHLHNALGRAVMIAVGDNWAKSRARRAGKRKAYYLSAEYLVGRLVYNNLFNLGILDEMRGCLPSAASISPVLRRSRTRLSATAVWAVLPRAIWTAPPPAACR